jgi:peptide-methionine (S)-S-oxide reductase
MSILFFHNADQKGCAIESKAITEERLGAPVLTEIVPYTRFFSAEDYHQKYYLQNMLKKDTALRSELTAAYPSYAEFLLSTLAMRMNAWVKGYRDEEMLREALSKKGLDTLLPRFVELTHLVKR